MNQEPENSAEALPNLDRRMLTDLHSVTVRLNAAEMKVLKSLSSATHLKLGPYIRSVLFNRLPRVIPKANKDLDQRLRESIEYLARISDFAESDPSADALNLLSAVKSIADSLSQIQRQVLGLAK